MLVKDTVKKTELDLTTAELIDLVANGNRQVDLVFDEKQSDEDGYLHFGKYDGDVFLEGVENWQEPGENVEITHNNIMMPYPESDIIQNPLLNEEPVAYEFSE